MLKKCWIFDLSAFSKFDLKGEKTAIQKICTANIKNEIGKPHIPI